jgi:hypothetical protein
MAESWTTVKAADVRPGNRVRVRGSEFLVARIDSPFLGRDDMVCFIEDTPERWHAYPAAKAGDVEVQRG